MPPVKTVIVTAGPGRAVPFHHTTARRPGGALLILRESDGQLEVPLDAYVRGRIRVGDLVIVREPSVAPSKES